MYEIIAGIDSNENRGVAQAKKIAAIPMDPDTVHVTLVHVFEDKADPAVSARNVASVHRAAQILEDAGIETTIVEADGNPVTALLEETAERAADLIVVAGRKRTPTGKALFGSVTQRVILNSDYPVLVVTE
ncbi:universal stress protein [Natronosalvus halobius]|uniref:universal stress protein n=1 Tax=Natronosalvus halobius TaxID=2953746 RepID=UPI0020A1FE27|nr:universal stress protein [Natronosalvus halobius]USZ73642.1 universal stress protein [Natronosalvus halobius]